MEGDPVGDAAQVETIPSLGRSQVRQACVAYLCICRLTLFLQVGEEVEDRSMEQGGGGTVLRVGGRARGRRPGASRRPQSGYELALDQRRARTVPPQLPRQVATTAESASQPRHVVRGRVKEAVDVRARLRSLNLPYAKLPRVQPLRDLVILTS